MAPCLCSAERNGIQRYVPEADGTTKRLKSFGKSCKISFCLVFLGFRPRWCDSRRLQPNDPLIPTTYPSRSVPPIGPTNRTRSGYTVNPRNVMPSPSVRTQLFASIETKAQAPHRRFDGVSGCPQRGLVVADERKVVCMPQVRSIGLRMLWARRAQRVSRYSGRSSRAGHAFTESGLPHGPRRP